MNDTRTIDLSMEESRLLNKMIAKVMLYMGYGLVLTAAVAYYVTTIYSALEVFFRKQPMLMMVILFAPLVLSMVYSTSRIRSNYAASVGIFSLYSACMGFFFGILAEHYGYGIMYQSVLVTAVVFFTVAGFGYFTKKDLSSLGTTGMMLLIGGIVVSLINRFIMNRTVNFFMDYFFLAVFIGLTAYHLQVIKKNFSALIINQSKTVLIEGNEIMQSNEFKCFSIMSAFTLYITFINILIRVMSILGNSKGRRR